jgi:hypothetical protein
MTAPRLMSCPACGTNRTGAFRYCLSCAFDFDTFDSSSPAVAQEVILAAPSPTASSEFRHPVAVLIGVGLLAIVFWSAFTIEGNKPSGASGPIAVVSQNPTPQANATRSQVRAPSASASPIVAQSASASPFIAPTASPPTSQRPRSGRYALLDRCPNRTRCWLYTVRSGDNLFSIANYFGVTLETVRRLNPWTQTKGIRAGQQLVLPPPTR